MPLERADTQIAGLIRPAIVRARGTLLSPRGAALIALALAAPIAWVLFDWVTTGNPLYSLTGTQKTVETLKRQTGPVDLVLYGPRRLGEVLQWPGMVGALGGLVLGFAFLRRRSAPRPRRGGPRARRLRPARLRRPGDHRPLHDARRRPAGDLRRPGAARLAAAGARPSLAPSLAALRRGRRRDVRDLGAEPVEPRLDREPRPDQPGARSSATSPAWSTPEPSPSPSAGRSPFRTTAPSPASPSAWK